MFLKTVLSATASARKVFVDTMKDHLHTSRASTKLIMSTITQQLREAKNDPCTNDPNRR
jgi:hypothetical protein